jgi:hypothetical protein
MSRWGPSESGVLCAFSVAAESPKVMHAGA